MKAFACGCRIRRGGLYVASPSSAHARQPALRNWRPSLGSCIGRSCPRLRRIDCPPPGGISARASRAGALHDHHDRLAHRGGQPPPGADHQLQVAFSTPNAPQRRCTTSNIVRIARGFLHRMLSRVGVQYGPLTRQPGHRAGLFVCVGERHVKAPDGALRSRRRGLVNVSEAIRAQARRRRVIRPLNPSNAMAPGLGSWFAGTLSDPPSSMPRKRTMNA